ncbi:MAG: AI-2E family transporter [Bradyrhizobiaceae bacterium]|nr:AI-2E family transporter [Bradyrhizobiaceae bacterium]
MSNHDQLSREAPAGRLAIGNGQDWRLAAQAATVGIFIILLLAALSYAQTVAMPVAVAVIVGIVLIPLLTWAAEKGIPHWLSALVLVLLLFAALSGLLMLLADPVSEWIERAPELGARLSEKLRIFDGPMAAFNSLRESLAGASKDKPGIDIYSELVRPVLGVLTPAIGQMVIFFASLFFFLAGRETLRRRFLTFWGDRKTRLEAIYFLGDVESNLARYFAVITGINLALGVVLAGIAWLVGLPSPLVWGSLGFVLNFLPYIGPAVTIVMLLGVGLMVFETLVQALAAPALFLVATTIEGQFVTPGVVGLRLALNPLLVFLSVVFWAWFWGPFGALLAVPLLIIGNVAINYMHPQQAKLPG